MNNLVGRQIENYRIDALLGEGGMGSVYRAYDVNLARNVALKAMHSHLANQDRFQQRFMQEAQAIARLNHPSIVTIYSFGNRDGLLFLVMEFVNGLSLGSYLTQLAERRQVVQLNESLNIIAQSAEGLGYAHRQGVIHRDIKPDNILIKPLDRPDGSDEPPMRAILTDFGLAKLLEGGIETATGTFMGTLPYMSPEQALARPTDGRSDIYSLGVVLYQLATGRLPFDIRTPTDAVMKHLNETPPDPRRIQPGLPIAIDRVIARALAKKPEDRFQTAEDFAQTLRQAMTTLTERDVTTFVTDYTVVSLLTRLESEVAATPPSRMEPEPAPSDTGTTLVISRKGEAPRSLPLDANSYTIGRSADSDIRISGPGVSRRHARIERDGNAWRIVDLGSTNGTFLEDTPLQSEVGQTFTAGATARIGPFYLQLRTSDRDVTGLDLAKPSFPPTEQLQVPPGGTHIQSSSGRLTLIVSPTHAEILPGRAVDLRIEIYNHAPLDSDVQVSVQGLPPPWLNYSREPLQVPAGGRGIVPVSLRPPNDSSAKAGRHAYRILVSSAANSQDSATLSASITVQPFSRFSVDMRPRSLQGKGICRVLVRNQGNHDAEYQIRGVDPGRDLEFRPPQQTLQVPAGQSETADFAVSPAKRPALGRARELPLSFEVADSVGGSQTMSGSLNARPAIPTWLAISVGIVSLLVFVAAVVGTLVFAPGETTATPTEGSLVALDIGQSGTESAIQTQSAQETADAGAAASATSLAMTAIAEGDDDGDGLSNNREETLGTEPTVADTDGDGLSDGEEVNQYGTNPQNQDSDGDTLSDGDEVNLYGTAPLNADTDADGTPDGVEINNGSDPLLPPTETPLPEITPSQTPVPTRTPTPIPTNTSPPPGIWNGTWQGNCATLPCSAITLSHLAGSNTVSGSFDGGAGTIVGLIEGNRLSGTWSHGGSNGTIDFWIAADGRSWQGNWNKTGTWCGFRQGESTPSPCGVASWYGDWTSSCGVSSCNIITMTQDGAQVEGVYAGGGATLTGTVSGTVLTGQWQRGGSGDFEFFLDNANQFSGNWNNSNEWCGHRNGAGLPEPCLNEGGLVIVPIITPIIMVTIGPIIPLPIVTVTP